MTTDICPICEIVNDRTQMNKARTRRGSWFIECNRCHHIWDTDRSPSVEYNENRNDAKIWELYHVAKKRFEFDEDGRVTNLPWFGNVFGRRFGQYKKYLPTKENCDVHALDIGFGAGGALHHFNNEGYNVYGIDTNKTAVDFARDSLPNADIKLGLYTSKVFTQKMDFLVCFHILEHVPDVISFLNDLRRNMVPNGVMALEVPNVCNDWCMENDARKWKMWDDNGMHLQHFSHNSLLMALQKTGWRFVDFIGVEDTAREVLTLIAINYDESAARKRIWQFEDAPVLV